MGCRAGRGGIGLRTVDQRDLVGHEVVPAVAAALVGIRDGAAVLQAPFAGGADRTVDAARTRRGGRDDY